MLLCEVEKFSVFSPDLPRDLFYSFYCAVDPFTMVRRLLTQTIFKNKFRNFDGVVSILTDAVEPCVKQTSFLNKKLV